MMQDISKIGILGSGDVARTLGEAWQKAGYQVLLGSRNPGKVKGTALPVATLSEATAFGDVLVNATPGEVSLAVLQDLGAEALGGRTLIDASVGLTANMESVTFQVESGAELIQAAFPNVRVVKTLCTMTSTVMVNPTMLEHPTTVFLSGDDAASKALVRRLLGHLGWDDSAQLDLGGIRSARGQEHFAMLYFALTETLGHGDFNIAVHTVPRAEEQ